MSSFFSMGPRSFEGIPVDVSNLVPEGEVWLINPGIKAEIMCHEGPHSGETVETWLRKSSAVRVINISPLEPLKPPRKFPLEL